LNFLAYFHVCDKKLDRMVLSRKVGAVRVLVASGTGLIGRAFCKELFAAGHQVQILSRNPSRAKLPPGAEIYKWDARSTQGWQNLLESADVVVNLAGENIGMGRWTPERKRSFLTSRQDAGKAIVEAFRTASHRPGLLLQASAIGYYGICADEIIDEASPPGKDFLAQIAVKWEAFTQPVEDLGVRRVIIRTGLILTQDGGVLPRFILPYKLFVGGPMGSGRQWWSWIHMQDEVNAMRFLIESDSAYGVYNLTAPNPVPMDEFGRTLARVIKRPYWLPAPAFAFKLLLGEQSTLVLDGQRVVPKSLLELGFQFKFPNLRSALENLLS
jgi:uncharacterized protein (TIGR01777 family)